MNPGALSVSISAILVVLMGAGTASAQIDARLAEISGIDGGLAAVSPGPLPAGGIPGVERSAPISSTNPGAFYTGATEIVPAGAAIGQGERFALIDFVSNPSPAHDIHFFDEALNQVGTIQVLLEGPHCTGLAWDSTTGTFWVSDFLAPIPAFVEYDGAGFATGNTIILCGSHPSGGIAIDTSFGRRVLYAYSGGSDTVRAWDMDAGTEITEGISGCGGSCPLLESPDGNPSAGFGLDTAADPQRCTGGSLVIATGPETAIATVSQFGYSEDPTTCPTPVDPCFSCDLATPLAAAGEFVPQGIVEFLAQGNVDRDLFVVGAGTATVFVLECAAGIGDCQNIDTDANTLFVNASRGGADFIVEIDGTEPLAASIQRPNESSNGKFVVHLNAGFAGPTTITSLLDLGSSCHPILDPAASGIWNNVGKTNRVGASQYFGTAIPDPPRADAFFWLLPSGDLANLPSGSRWTLQGVILNPNASSSRGASLTNGIQLEIR